MAAATAAPYPYVPQMDSASLCLPICMQEHLTAGSKSHPAAQPQRSLTTRLVAFQLCDTGTWHRRTGGKAMFGKILSNPGANAYWRWFLEVESCSLLVAVSATRSSGSLQWIKQRAWNLQFRVTVNNPSQEGARCSPSFLSYFGNMRNLCLL